MEKRFKGVFFVIKKTKEIFFKDKNKTQVNQKNISYNLNNFLAPDIWTNCQDRKVGDQKEFIDLDFDTGLYKKETHEIIDIKHTFINERKDRLTKTLVHSIDEDSGEPTSYESLSNSKCELLSFSLNNLVFLPNYSLNFFLQCSIYNKINFVKK